MSLTIMTISTLNWVSILPGWFFNGHHEDGTFVNEVIFSPFFAVILSTCELRKRIPSVTWNSMSNDLDWTVGRTNLLGYFLFKVPCREALFEKTFWNSFEHFKMFFGEAEYKQLFIHFCTHRYMFKEQMLCNFFFS